MHTLCRRLLVVGRSYSCADASSLLQHVINTEKILSKQELDAAKTALLHPSHHDYNINLSLAALKRIVQEPHDNSPQWIPIAVNTVLQTWKQGSKRNLPGIPSPSEIMNTLLMDPALDNSSTRLHRNSGYGTVLEVLLHQAPRTQGPFLAEQFVQNHIRQPDGDVYWLLLDSWAGSGLAAARDKIEQLEAEMEKARIPYTRKILLTLLRFWGTETNLNVDRMDMLWENLTQKTTIEPDIALWASLAVGYARSEDRLESARIILLRKILYPKDKLQHNRSVSGDAIEVAAELMTSYRRRLVSDLTSSHVVLKGAQEVLHALVERKLDRDDAFITSAMSLFSEARRYRKVHWLYGRLKNRNEMTMAILLNALVRSNLPTKGTLASRFLYDIRKNNELSVSPRLATLVLLAWAKSGARETAKKALSIHKHLEHALSREAPSIAYYNALLECVCASGGKEVVQRTNHVLDLISEHGLEANEITYTVAIQACLRGGDNVRADEILAEMADGQYPPTIRTFNAIMAHRAKVGVLSAAIRVEQLVLDLHRKSRIHPKLSPNVYSYNIIFNAWAKVDCEFSSNRMMKVYDRMQRMGIEPNSTTFNTLIHHLTANGVWADIMRSQDILTTLEEHSAMKPTRRHYNRIMQAWNLIKVPELGEKMLKRRINAYLNGNERVAPISANFHQVMQSYLNNFEPIHASNFLLKMMRTSKEQGLPHKPELISFQKLSSFWQTTAHPQRPKYERRLENVMKKEWPHLLKASNRNHTKDDKW